MAPLWHFWQIILTYLQQKNPWNYSSKMSEHSRWKFLLITWVISLRVHKHGFVLLNRLRIVTNTVFRNPRPANNWKMNQNGFHSKHLCTYIVTYLYSIACTQTPDSNSTDKNNNNKLLTKERILVLSSLARNLQLKQG
mgnify:CR=1 FL=1